MILLLLWLGTNDPNRSKPSPAQSASSCRFRPAHPSKHRERACKWFSFRNTDNHVVWVLFALPKTYLLIQKPAVDEKMEGASQQLPLSPTGHKSLLRALSHKCQRAGSKVLEVIRKIHQPQWALHRAWCQQISFTLCFNGVEQGKPICGCGNLTFAHTQMDVSVEMWRVWRTKMENVE